MSFSGLFVLYLIVALVAFVLTMTMKSWVLQLVFFIVTIGAANLAMTAAALGSGWVLLVNAVLLLAIGANAVRVVSTGNRVLGIVLLVLGVFSLFLAINSLGTEMPGTVWDAIVRSFQQGWTTTMDILQNVFGGA